MRRSSYLSAVAGVATVGAIFSLGMTAFAAKKAQAKSKESYYVGLQAGTGGIYSGSVDASKIGNYVSKTESVRQGIASRVFFGRAWRLSNGFTTGFETGISLYPQNDYTVVKSGYTAKHSYNGYAFDFLGTLKYGLSECLTITGKLGMALVSQTDAYAMSGNYSVNNRQFTNQRFVPETALTLGYAFTDHFDFDVSYNHMYASKIEPFHRYNYDSAVVGSEANNKVGDVKLITAGFTYHF